jgi:hypothetical protein
LDDEKKIQDVMKYKGFRSSVEGGMASLAA